MQVTETLSDGLKREFKVVVGAADLDKELNRKLTELAGRANIKGFRPGKVPVPHLKRVYGKSMMAEVVQEQLDEASKKLLSEHHLKPAYKPEVKLPEDQEEVEKIFAGQGDLAYTMAFEVIPSFELADVSGITLERHVVELTPEQRARKAQAIACYAGEVAKLEAVFGSITDEERLAFEVFWLPK